MAITATNRGAGASNASSSTTYAFSPASNCTAGKTVVIFIAADNSSSGGSTNNITNVTDSVGNTWTQHRNPIFDNGAANAGVQVSIWSTKQNIGQLTTGSTITVTFGANTTAKSYTLTELSGDTGVVNYLTGGDDTDNTLNFTTGSITSGDAVVCGYGYEAGTTQTGTGDADTTNGSWTTAQYAEVGSTTSGSVVLTQAKVTTGTGTQTFNPTFGLSGDKLGSWAIFHEVVNTTVTPSAGTLTLTGAAPTVRLNKIATPPAGTLTLTGYAPTVRLNKIATPPAGTLTLTGAAPTVSTPRVATPPAGTLTLTGYAPTVTVEAGGGVLVTPSAGTLTLTGAAPTVLLPKLVAPPAGTLTLTGSAPTVTVSNHRLVTPPAGALTLTGAAPTVTASDHKLVVVPAGTLTLVGAAPSALAPRTATPPAGTLTLQGHAPTVTATNHVLVRPGAGLLTLVGYPPDVTGEVVVVEAPPVTDGRGKRKAPYDDWFDWSLDADDEAVILLAHGAV